MNNDAFTNSGVQGPSFNSGDALRNSLRARGMKTVGEQKAEGTIKPSAEQSEGNNNNQIATALGNRLLRDIGAAMFNPVKGSFDFTNHLAQTMFEIPFSMANQGKQNDKKEEPVVEETTEETVKEEPKTEETTENPADEGETIEYTYKAGDNFGQVIKDLGLESGNGLWGDNGDVNYYNQQLLAQGIWPDGQTHNIPIGTTIRLKRRPMTQAMIDYRNQYGYN